MLAILSLLSAMVSVQIGAAFAKSLFPILGPIPTVMLRISIAAMILALVWRPWRTKITKKSAKAILLYGTTLGLMNITFYLSLTRIPLGICVALEFTGPLTVALFSSKHKTDLVWAILATIGIILILPLKTGQAPLDTIGILLALFAGACWAFYIVMGNKLGALLHAGTATSLGMIVAAIVTLPFGLATVHFASLTPNVLFWGAAVAILSSAIPYSIEMVAMKKIPIKTFGIFMSLEPAIAALSALLILREHLYTSQWLAILCVITASAGSALNNPGQSVPNVLDS